MSETESDGRDRIRLEHMLESAREAVAFATGMTLDQLESDRLRALALTRCVEIVGEAAATVSSQFRDSHSEIPWRIIVATRNRLIHAYFDVDLNVLLDTISKDLPALITSLESILASD